jgi:hypothetical protein
MEENNGHHSEKLPPTRGQRGAARARCAAGRLRKRSREAGVTIVLRRRPDGAPVPEPAHYLRTPPSQRRRLSEPAFAAPYGADPAEIEKVVDFARSHGLTMDETNAARHTRVVSGTIGEFNKAFNISLHNYEHEVERSRRLGRRTDPITATTASSTSPPTSPKSSPACSPSIALHHQAWPRRSAEHQSDLHHHGPPAICLPA